mgnify:CR=1 FL=1
MILKQFTIYLLLLAPILSIGQKSYSIQQCEDLFRKNNLSILAEQYNIDLAKANEIQAKIWDLPYISGEFNAINPQYHNVLDVGKYGQKAFAIQQLIYLGGKKQKEVDFAKANTAIATLQFEQLVRNLKYQLNTDFYNIYFDQKKIKTLDFQIVKLDTLLNSYVVQSDKGNIPLKEVVRLQSLILSLKSDRNSLQKDIVEKIQELNLIIGETDTIVPVVNENEISNKFTIPKILKDSIISQSLQKNPEYLTFVKISESQDLYLKWQKSLAVPDLTAGISYDQRGGAFLNQINFTFGIPIPLWNKNKGNIKAAEVLVNQSAVNLNYKKLELENQIETAWKLWNLQYNQFSSINMNVYSDLESVYKGIIANFEKRNITLLEFTDFIESYNLSNMQLNEFKKLWILSGIQLNYVSNLEVF